MAKFFTFCLLVALFMTTWGQPWVPSPRPEDWWMDRHAQFVRTSQQNGHNIRAIFLGSSVVEYWSSTALTIWNEKYSPVGAVNYGIGGDRIEHCLWRVVNGELENVNPRLLVLYCGSNNIAPTPNPDDIVRGISTTINEIHARLPNTTILYVPLFPRADISPIMDTFQKLASVNDQVQAIHGDQEKTRIFSIFDDFIISWGEIDRAFYVSDGLHFNFDGYQHWDNLWSATFFELLNGK